MSGPHRTTNSDRKLNVGALALPFLFLACSPEGDPPEGGGGTFAEMSSEELYADWVQPMLENKCTESCHEAEGYMPDLVFGTGVSADALVGVPSVQVPTMNVIEPGDLATSYLWHKLQGTHEEVGGEGDKMPYEELSQDELDAVEAYILNL